jgi:hypothetical protein
MLLLKKLPTYMNNNTENPINQQNSYTIKEISKWHLDLSSEIKLPLLQRGFVWKAHQIEALWDSILRGYPIGAVLMSVDYKRTERFLLDGKQRSISIALGYLDPFNTKENIHLYSLKDSFPSIWIDLMPSEISQNQIFNIKVLTKSHPWGYQTQRDEIGNRIKLSKTERNRALTYFKTKNTGIESDNDLNKTTINPWDANYPVPLSWLLNNNYSSFNTFKFELINKISQLYIQTQHSKEQNVNFELLEDKYLFKVFKGITNAKNLIIPEITVKSEILQEDFQPVNVSFDPLLLKRLNSFGTRIIV